MSLKNKKFLLIVLFVLVSVMTAIGQNTFIRCLSFPGNAWPRSVYQTQDGNFVVSGALNNHLLVFKIDPFGTMLWLHIYNTQ